MDTSIARRNILARIRAAQGREPEPSAAEREAAADYLARHPAGPRPEMPADLVARFIEQARKMATTVESVQALSDVPAAAHRYLMQHALPLQAIAWQTLQDLQWAEAGLTVDAAFGRVARELGKAYPELGDEFGLTAIELGFLAERRAAFENLANRVDLEAVRGVVTTMIQTEKYGTPLASALRVLSAEFRHQRMMRAEEKAARLPAIMTVPLILFILPTLFVVILGPASCSINDSFLHG